MRSLKKILIVGCSMSAGTGFDLGLESPDIWPNLLCKRLAPEAELTNLSSTGVNNHWIANEAASAIRRCQYDLVLVAWTNIPKYNIPIGLETYSVHSRLWDTEINLNNNVTVSIEWLRELGDRLRRYHKDHWDILDLIKYVNNLAFMQDSRQANSIFFINALGPWPVDYFKRKSWQVPSELDSYTQNMLQVDTRDDDEIRRLYNMIHDQYDHYGGILEGRWLNLYNNFRITAVDQVTDTNKHPGPRSQIVYADMIEQALRSRL